MSHLSASLQLPSKPILETVEVQKPTIETIYNHVYFYGEVDTGNVLNLMTQIREVDDLLRSERGSRSLPSWVSDVPIWLHVQSGGGSLFAGFSAADQLAGIESPIYSIVEGCCASAATLLSMACTHRYITPNAFMLIHQLSSDMWGKYGDLKDEMRMLDMAMERVVEFYAKRTKLKKKKVRKLLGRESWFNAEECIRAGLADDIYEGYL